MGTPDLPRRQEDLRDDGVEHGPSILDRLQTGCRRATRTATGSRIFSPPYWGPSGWLGIDIDSPSTDWTEIAELIDTSFRMVALKRQLTALDSGDSAPLV